MRGLEPPERRVRRVYIGVGTIVAILLVIILIAFIF
jgi:hypothetical protein